MAVHRRGLGIADLQWKMRIKNVVTLRADLQEATTLASMGKLPDGCRACIMAAQQFYHSALTR